LPEDPTDALLRIARSPDERRPQADALENRSVYFEIYRADHVSLTSILSSGGDWRWQFCSATGKPIATGVGYASESACAAAVAALRAGAGGANVRTRSH
jgi:uncharacterized protein YegP (UPF0339 family)